MKTVFILLIILSIFFSGGANAQKITTISGMCDATRERAVLSKGPETYTVILLLLFASGTTYTAPDRNEILQKWWKENYHRISCTERPYEMPAGGLLKQLIMGDFRAFAIQISGPESTYNLDLNVLDPVDNLTILDWIKKELENPDTIDADRLLLLSYQKFFRSKGAKTSEELNISN